MNTDTVVRTSKVNSRQDGLPVAEKMHTLFGPDFELIFLELSN